MLLGHIQYFLITLRKETRPNAQLAATSQCEGLTDAKRLSILTNKTGTSILIACRVTSGRHCEIYYLDSEGRVKGGEERRGGDGADKEKRERETGSAL